MKAKTIKGLACLLSFVMIVGLMPATSLAAPATSIVVNGTDILSVQNHTVQCGNGTAVYDLTENTLTLKDAEITNSLTGDTNGGIVFSGGDLTIVLEGTNTITSDGCGIVSSGSTLTIKGSGSRDGSESSEEIEPDSLSIQSASYGIREGSYGNVVIEDAKVGIHVTGGSRQGIHAEGTLTIQNGADVTSTGIDYSLTANGGIVITDSSVKAEVTSVDAFNAIITDAGISISNSKLEAHSKSDYDTTIWAAGDVTISAGSDVTVTSTVSNGLYTQGNIEVFGSTLEASSDSTTYSDGTEPEYGTAPPAFAEGNITISEGEAVVTTPEGTSETATVGSTVTISVAASNAMVARGIITVSGEDTLLNANTGNSGLCGLFIRYQESDCPLF